MKNGSFATLPPRAYLDLSCATLDLLPQTLHLPRIPPSLLPFPLITLFPVDTRHFSCVTTLQRSPKLVSLRIHPSLNKFSKRILDLIPDYWLLEVCGMVVRIDGEQRIFDKEKKWNIFLYWFFFEHNLASFQGTSELSGSKMKFCYLSRKRNRWIDELDQFTGNDFILHYFLCREIDQIVSIK